MAAIREGVAPAEAFKRLARKNMAALAGELERARGNGTSAVHDARKRLKLLRSLLRLLKAALGKEAFREGDASLRRAHHLLADARRAGAMQETVRKLSDFARSRDMAVELAPLAKALESEGEAALDVGALEPAIGEAAQSVASLRGALEGWRLPKRDVSLFVEGLRDCYARARRDLARGFAEDDIERLHDARKAVIHLRYQLQMIAPIWPAVLKPWSKELQVLRELLGDLADLAELQALPAAAQATDPAVADLIKSRQAELRAEAKALAERLFAEKPAAFADRLSAVWAAAGHALAIKDEASR